MKGIQFVLNDRGKRTAVIIDLKVWGEVWEDIYDSMVAYKRRNEPTVAWKDIKKEMQLEDEEKL